MQSAEIQHGVEKLPYIFLSIGTAFLFGPIVQLLICIVMSIVVGVVSIPVFLHAFQFLGVIFVLLMLSFHGISEIYTNYIICHIILCLCILPPCKILVAAGGGTLRTMRFVLCVSGALSAAALIRLAGGGAALGWLAGFGGLCTALCFSEGRTCWKAVIAWFRAT